MSVIPDETKFVSQSVKLEMGLISSNFPGDLQLFLGGAYSLTKHRSLHSKTSRAA